MDDTRDHSGFDSNSDVVVLRVQDKKKHYTRQVGQWEVHNKKKTDPWFTVYIFPKEVDKKVAISSNQGLLKPRTKIESQLWEAFSKVKTINGEGQKVKDINAYIQKVQAGGQSGYFMLCIKDVTRPAAIIPILSSNSDSGRNVGLPLGASPNIASASDSDKSKPLGLLSARERYWVQYHLEKKTLDNTTTEESTGNSGGKGKRKSKKTKKSKKSNKTKKVNVY